MADRPILFSAPMVRALLDGRKTQTRRILKNPEFYGCPTGDCPHQTQGECNAAMASLGPEDARYAIGDRLYVREEYYQFGHWEPIEGVQTKGGQQKWKFVGTDRMATFDQPADFLSSRSKPFPGLPRWYKRLGRFMPRALSRLTLTVTEVRVERLQDCSAKDAVAEGIHWPDPEDRGLIDPGVEADGRMAVRRYADLWNTINGPGAWEANPWVVAVTFTVGRHNIDAGVA